MIMSSIRLDNLAKGKRNKQKETFVDYTYVDIFLDLQSDKMPNVIHNDDKIDRHRDLRIAPDEEAIKNSLINLFNTRPGQRILIPDYGTNLLGYVFESVTVTTAKALGLQVEQAIKRWEPRVRIERIQVLADPDNHQYQLTIEVSVPSLTHKRVSFTGVLSQEGFTETNTSRYI